MTKRKPKPDEKHIEWTAHGDEPVTLRCANCGTVSILPLPMELGLFTTQLGYFRKAHLDCKAKDAATLPLLGE